MKIVVLDSRPLDDGDIDWLPLSALGELILHGTTAPEQVVERIAGADVVVTNKVPVRRDAIESSDALRLICVLATGYDVIDAAFAHQRGVVVCNVPGYSAAFTAQTTIALVLELCHHVGAHSDAVRSGQWSKSATFSFWNFPLVDLGGKTWVIVGLGAIGRRVAAAAEVSGAKVVGAQLPGREAAPSDYPRLPLDEALVAADIVSLHCPLTPVTRGLFDARRLSLMKRSALLVNAARGPLVVDQDLADALEAGTIAGFASDVLASKEIPDAANPLLSASNTIITPHIAWASPECRRRLVDVTAANIGAFCCRPAAEPGGPTSLGSSGYSLRLVPPKREGNGPTAYVYADTPFSFRFGRKGPTKWEGGFFARRACAFQLARYG